MNRWKSGRWALALSSLLAGLSSTGCEQVGRCNEDDSNHYNDVNRGDRCPLEILDHGTVKSSASTLRFLPVQGEAASTARLMISGEVNGAVADGYGVELRIMGKFDPDDPEDPPASGDCTAAFELAPTSELDVCTSTSPSVLRCVFDAVGQLGVTVSTLSSKPISDCSVVARSGDSKQEISDPDRLRAEVTQLKVSYPLDTLTLAARLPVTLGACGDAANPCVVPQSQTRAYCSSAPACDTLVGLPLYFVSERSGQQIASGQDIVVQISDIPQTTDAAPLSFQDSCGGMSRSTLTVAKGTGESPVVQACVDGRGGTYELRGRVSDAGVVLTDSVFVAFPALPPRVSHTWDAKTGVFTVSVTGCAGVAVDGVDLGVEFSFSDGSSESVLVPTDGAGQAMVPLVVPQGAELITAKVTLGAWDTTCEYQVQ